MAVPDRYGRTPWLVLAASLLLTAAGTALIAWSGEQRDRARFENAVQNAHDRIVSRLDVYTNTLRGGAALFAVSESITQEDFRSYVARLEVQRRYPGIQGIGWTERVRAGWPDSPVEVHAIRYLEPLDRRNQAALGYDMYSEQTRRAAMARARDRAEPSLSGRVVLVQEIIGPRQPGFLLYVPVYRGSEVPESVAERRRLLRGFVYSPFRANDLFAGIFGTEEEPRVSFAVYDGVAGDTSALLHASPATPDHTPSRRAEDTLRIGGRRWHVSYASEPAFDQGSTRGIVPGALFAGLLFSAWLFRLAWAQARARAASDAAARTKSSFLATMSHELRTPLNAIGGYVDLIDLEVAGPVSEQQREYLGRILRAQRHLLGLINDVLNFAKLDAGKVSFRREPVRLQAVVAEVQGFVLPQMVAKGVEFTVRGGADLLLLADADKVRQILINLLSNATKFTNPGGSVVIDWAEQGQHARIAVRDTGVGIPAERLREIFDPFVQVETDLTRSRQGTGLGLSISRELAANMGGTIRVESELGKGSTFTLELPLLTADAPVDGQAAD